MKVKRLEKIYNNRFEDERSRAKIWQVLVGEFFQQYVNDHGAVLDLACGRGEFINTVRAKTKIAVDINEKNKKYIKRDIKFFRGSSTNMNFIRSSSLDQVFVSNFFEHIERGAIEKTVGELYRILKKGGSVLVLQPNIRFISRDYWMFFDHVTPVDDRALREVFESYGFTLVKKIERFLPYTTKSRLPQFPFLVRLYLKLPLLWRVLGKQSFLVFEKST